MPGILIRDAIAAAAILVISAVGPTFKTPNARTMQLNSRLQLDAAYRRGWVSAQTRAVVDAAYATGEWTGDATAYEAFLSVKPAPSLTVDAGKKTLKWGKG